MSYAPGRAIVVDPGEAGRVLAQLGDNQLTHILLTHHHPDHSGGVAELQSRFGARLINNTSACFSLGALKIEVIETPGHTADSCCFHVYEAERHLLFSGDTLFVGGCGRLFECAAPTMYASLQRLKLLPAQTEVFAGHNYTAENYAFASLIEPRNGVFIERLAWAQAADEDVQPTVPSSLGEELRSNIFMLAPDVRTFSQLRERKNSFS